MIVTAEHVHFPVPERPELTPPEAIVYRFWRHRMGEVPVNVAGQLKGDWPAGVHDTLTAQVRVNHGRWVVDCPRGCGSAQMASKGDRRMFCVECTHAGDRARWCLNCAHSDDLRWIPVTWPSELEISTIEAVLDARPHAENRNWTADESVEQLVAENTAHGIAPAGEAR